MRGGCDMPSRIIREQICTSDTLWRIAETCWQEVAKQLGAEG